MGKKEGVVERRDVGQGESEQYAAQEECYQAYMSLWAEGDEVAMKKRSEQGEFFAFHGLVRCSRLRAYSQSGNVQTCDIRPVSVEERRAMLKEVCRASQRDNEYGAVHIPLCREVEKDVDVSEPLQEIKHRVCLIDVEL